jgi:hypothetical protein
LGPACRLQKLNMISRSVQKLALSCTSFGFSVRTDGRQTGLWPLHLPTEHALCVSIRSEGGDYLGPFPFSQSEPVFAVIDLGPTTPARRMNFVYGRVEKSEISRTVFGFSVRPHVRQNCPGPNYSSTIKELCISIVQKSEIT